MMIIVWFLAGVGILAAGIGIGYYVAAKAEEFDMLMAKNKKEEMSDAPCGVQKLAQIILTHLGDSEQDLQEALEDFIKTLAERRDK